MNTVLQKLDKLLSVLRPDFYARFHEGLSDQQISDLEQKYGIEVPKDLQQFYRWKNGHDAYTANVFIKGSTIYPLEVALATAKEQIESFGDDVEENWWNEKWIPLFCDGGGNYICYDTGGFFTGKKGQLLTFWHDSPYREVIAPSLEVFLDKVSEVYETKEAGLPDEAYVTDGQTYTTYAEIEGYPIEFTVGFQY